MPIGAVKVAGGGLAVSQAAVGYGAPFILAPTGIAVTVVASGGLPIADAGSGIFVTPATFNPASATANVALSNGNLTAKNTVDSAVGGVKAAPLFSAGKFYFELAVIQANGSFNAAGLMTSSTDYAGFGVNGSAGAVSVSRGGVININGTSTGVNLGTFVTPGDVCGIAVDLTAHLVWCRKGGGNWNNSGVANPAAAAGGLTFPAAALAPAIGFAGSAPVNDGYTANFGATAYANAAPSGFGNWPGS